jgi:hypothetical protein
MKECLEDKLFRLINANFETIKAPFQMQKSYFLLLSLTLILLSCHRKDEKFCSCLDKSKEVNQLTEKIWGQDGTQSDSLKLKKLLLKKSKLKFWLKKSYGNYIVNLNPTAPVLCIMRKIYHLH